jgi:glycosyltransferase involved in cell wall biosynthesis
MIYIDQRAVGNFGIGRFSTEIGNRYRDAKKFTHHSNPFSFWDPFTLHLSLPDDLTFFVSTNVSGPFLSDVPYAICIHDLVQLDLPKFFPVAKRIYFKYITRFIAKRASLIFTVSNYSKDRISHHFGIDPSKIVVLGNAPSEIFSTSKSGDAIKIARGGKFFLNYSSSKKYKNLEGLIRAYQKICPSITEDLLIVGDQSFISPDVDLEGRIHFIGNVTDAELVLYLQNATALVFPSLYEGFGIPIVEAMSCGCPVITSNLASMPEVSRGAALLVNPYDDHAIAKAMYDLSRLDSISRSKIVEAGLLVSDSYSWDVIVDIMSESVNNYLRK